MKTTIKVTTAITVCCIVLFTMCTKDKADKTQGTSTQTEVKGPEGLVSVNSYLKFDDMEHFRATMEEIMNQSRSFLDNWEQQKNHLSLRRYFTILGMETEENYIPDRYYATILNRDGVFSIADTIYMMKETAGYIIPPGGEYAIPILSELLPNEAEILANDAINELGIIYREVDNTLKQGGVDDPTDPLDPDDGGRTTQIFTRRFDCQTQYGWNPERKLVGEVWNMSAFAYHSFGCRTKNEKKRAVGGGFDSENIDYIEVKWKVVFKRNDWLTWSNLPSDGNYKHKPKTEDGDVEEMHYWEVGNAHYFQVQSSHTYHNIWWGSNNVNCEKFVTNY